MIQNNNHTTSRQFIFMLLAGFFLVSLIAFVITNFIFLAAHLNKAFGFEPQPSPQTVQFDKAGFEALGLTK